VAGIVNVAGLFAVKRLTTNVTGHFAFFADEVAKQNYRLALIFLLYIFAFFFGAFCSNFIVEAISRRNARWMNIVPIGIEIVLLTAVALLSPESVSVFNNTIACVLLFAMGMQNALVTSISGAIVRTTHLTGLFTDLGIELSQLFFFRKAEQQQKLRSSIQLRLTIIIFFFLGGITGGVGFTCFQVRILLLAVAVLLGGLLYDTVKFKVVALRRKYRS
jgi:uncharacterized membrane protein YoaK (UPF0700 family)